MKMFFKTLLIVVIVNVLIFTIFDIFQINNIKLEWYLLGTIDGLIWRECLLKEK